MRKYHQFVTTVDDVVQNAMRFHRDLADKEIGPSLSKILPLVHHWYAHLEADGWFTFVPSKFAGYKNMSGKIYLASYKLPKAEGGLHGKDTELALKSLAVRLPSDTWHSAYDAELSNWLSNAYGFRRRNGSTISVLKGYPLDPDGFTCP